MKLLILGAAGDLGSALAKQARLDGHEVTAFTRADLDVTDGTAVWESQRTVAHEVVVNCTAFHRVDECERAPLLADLVNREAVETIALGCDLFGSSLVHISTDYVFDGTKRTPYVENDAPRPINVYGLSKWLGEREIAHVEDLRWLIVRTSGLFGGDGSSQKGGDFIERILAVMYLKEPIRVVDDLTFAPTYVPDLARAILDLAHRKIRGIVHLAGSEATTWADFAQEALDITDSGHSVCRIKSSNAAGTAPRPAYSVLGSQRSASGHPLPSYRIGLAEYVRKLVAR